MQELDELLPPWMNRDELPWMVSFFFSFLTFLFQMLFHIVCLILTHSYIPILHNTVFPKKINFELSETIKRKIYYAETAIGDEIVASDTKVLEFTDYGKNFITANKLSPDSYVQMSMMLAYYKLYGKVVCAYEPVLTKSFYHGRTEAMRPATMEAKHLCEVFCNTQSTSDEKLAVLRNAARVHSELVKECARGKGVDRHLFALKCIAEKYSMPIPNFFNAEPWKMLNHTILSTSNCGNPSLGWFGFGPVVPGAYTKMTRG
jgi:carnitine O-acetyltransferase